MTEDELREIAGKMLEAHPLREIARLSLLYDGVAALLTHEADKIRDERSWVTEQRARLTGGTNQLK